MPKLSQSNNDVALLSESPTPTSTNTPPIPDNKENINTEIALSMWHLAFVKCIDSKVYILIYEKLSHCNEFIIKAAQLMNNLKKNLEYLSKVFQSL